MSDCILAIDDKLGTETMWCKTHEHELIASYMGAYDEDSFWGCRSSLTSWFGSYYPIIYKGKIGYVHYKRRYSLSPGGITPAFDITPVFTVEIPDAQTLAARFENEPNQALSGNPHTTVPHPPLIATYPVPNERVHRLDRIYRRLHREDAWIAGLLGLCAVGLIVSVVLMLRS